MRVRNKEHQSLSRKQLKELCYDYPNDAMLGEQIRKLANDLPTSNYWEYEKMDDNDFKTLQKIIDQMLEKEMELKRLDKKHRGKK